MPKPCGTEAAYYRHRYHGEEPCTEDRAAASNANKRRAWAKGKHRPQVPMTHGTNGMYVSGCRCQFCKDAHADYMRQWRQTGRGRVPRRPSEPAFTLTDKVLDWLLIDGGWMTAHGISEDLACSVETVERLLRTLRDEGLVESRVVEITNQLWRMEWSA